MKIETDKDKGFFGHDFKAPWTNPISYEEWGKFLQHNMTYGRKEAYDVINDCVSDSRRRSFLEIGFGQCYDFDCCFQRLHNFGNIMYNGWEVTKQFVEYAKRKYPVYSNCFDNLSFDSLQLSTNITKYRAFDIIYTRHTLEHQHPNNGYKYFINILKATKELAVVVWFKPPGVEKLTWNSRDGDGKGAYVNTYSRAELTNIINQHSFELKKIKVEFKDFVNEIWVMRRA